MREADGWQQIACRAVALDFVWMHAAEWAMSFTQLRMQIGMLEAISSWSCACMQVAANRWVWLRLAGVAARWLHETHARGRRMSN